jgi:hypothetical protein
MVRAIKAIADGSSSHAQRARIRLFQLYIDRYGVDATQAPELALSWLLRFADAGGFEREGSWLGRLFDAFGMQLPEEISLEPLLHRGVLDGSHVAFEDLKKYYPGSYEAALAMFRECGGCMIQQPPYVTYPWINLQRPQNVLEIYQNNTDAEIQDVLASDNADTLLHCAARAGYLDTWILSWSWLTLAWKPMH